MGLTFPGSGGVRVSFQLKFHQLDRPIHGEPYERLARGFPGPAAVYYQQSPSYVEGNSRNSFQPLTSMMWCRAVTQGLSSSSDTH